MAIDCNHPTCYDSEFCRRPAKEKKRQKPIRKFSRKRAAVNKEQYGPKAREFVKQNPICAIQSPVCTRFAECVNHKKGKSSIELLLDEKYWEPACVMCNQFIEDNDSWARENGHKVSRND